MQKQKSFPSLTGQSLDAVRHRGSHLQIIASAGSGKTYTLTKEYLKILFLASNNDAYKKILAITFTNKAVEEMKSRIVSSLYEFSIDTTSDKAMELLKDVASETQLSLATLKDKSKAIIKNIIAIGLLIWLLNFLLNLVSN